jgi:hypothetical protein
MPAILAASESMSGRVASAEAIWSLIHHGFLVPMAQPQGQAPTLSWTTVVTGSGGESSSWTFDSFFLPYPACVKRAPSLQGASNQLLAERDLYLSTISVQNMHRDISDAFREAVKCFRYELFTSAITMLGKASEGAWLELGGSLITAVPQDQEHKFRKQKARLEDPMEGTFNKIKAVITVYEQQDVFEAIARASGIRLEELGTGAVCLHLASDFCARFWHSAGMPTRPSKKKSLDFSQIALEVVEAATHTPLIQKPTNPPKNPAAVALGLLGASKGGYARAKSLSARKRSQIAKKAAKTRWAKG